MISRWTRRHLLSTLVRHQSTAAPARPPIGLAYDLETTGLAEDCDILQMAVKIVRCSTVAGPALPLQWEDPHEAIDFSAPLASGAEFMQFSMPTSQAIASEAAAVHGLTEDVLFDRGANAGFEQTWEALRAWLHELGLDDADQPLVWVAHNGNRFDHARFYGNALRSGFTPPPSWRFTDTLPMARRLVDHAPGTRTGTHTLGALYRRVTGDDIVGAHDALADARALSRVWPALVLQRPNAPDPGMPSHPADDAAFDAGLFAAYLRRCCAPPAASTSRGGSSTRTRKRRRSSSSSGGGGTKKVSGPRNPLTAIPGVGDRTAAQLTTALGVSSVAELVGWFVTEGGADKKKCAGRLRGKAMGLHPIAAAKIAKFLAEEHGGGGGGSSSE